ncbi:MAG: GDP-mannose 4,6-dehydratase [Candidatus Hydrogenedentes bacterium]|nr:GDP-mannose 4,6-dehydratase [Candidatus Hydrogenedentota bacterium]
MSRRALVTGANGFVGRRLCRHLRESGWDVREAIHGAMEDPRLQRQLNLGQAEDITSLLEWTGPLSHVFHLAAVTSVPEAVDSPVNVMEVNLLGTMRLVAAVERSYKNARFIFVSSSAVYGAPRQLPVTEQHPLEPGNPYAISKAAADEFCRYAHKASGMDIVRLRPFNHSGAGQDDRFVLSSFARQVAQIERGKRAPVLQVGNLEARRDFSHVDDVILAYELAALHAQPGEAYNICSGKAWSMQEALDRLMALAECQITVEIDESRLRPVDVLDITGSHDKFVSACGWRPAKGFDEILKDLLTHWREVEKAN